MQKKNQRKSGAKRAQASKNLGCCFCCFWVVCCCWLLLLLLLLLLGGLLLLLLLGGLLQPGVPPQKTQSPPYHCFLPSPPAAPSQPRCLLLIVLIIFILFISQSQKALWRRSIPMALWWLLPTHEESSPQLAGVALASQWLAFIHPPGLKVSFMSLAQSRKCVGTV